MHYFAWQGPRRMLYCRTMLRALLDSVADFDVVHVDAFWLYPGLAASLACRLKHTPYIISPRGMLIEGSVSLGQSRAKSLHLATAGRFMLDGAAAVHLTADLEKEQSSSRLRGRPTFVVPNPIDIASFEGNESRAQVRRRLNIPETAFVLAYSGRMHQRKALPVVIRALERVRRTMEDVYLVLAGPDRGQRALLSNLVSSLGLEAAVRFPGRLDRPALASVLGASDVVVLTPYEGENFGNACVEAMGLGLPAILSHNVGVASEAVAAGAAIVTRVDESDIAAAVERLNGDRPLAQSMGARARDYVLGRYSPRAVATEMMSHYQAVSSTKRFDTSLRSTGVEEAPPKPDVR